MSSNDYVDMVIADHSLPKTLDVWTNANIFNPLSSYIEEWAGDSLNSIDISGSRAKGTAINLSSDIDLFISLKSSVTTDLGKIYNSLYDFLVQKGLVCRKQNVSIRVFYSGKKVDLVPARKQDAYSDYHSLFRRKTGHWTQTNIKKHITNVTNSGRIKEIIALKIWRENHQLEFPSIYLETYVIEALKGKPYGDTANNFWFLLKDIKDNIMNRRIVDPSNSDNILSNELTNIEKNNIINSATESLKKNYWEEIIW